ncbi:MAG: SufB/SufD family protein [Verrucomicrobiales bacterium]
MNSVLASAVPAPDGAPAWFLQRRQAAWDRFLSTPSPLRTDEKWRFSSVKQPDLTGYVAAPEPTVPVAIPSHSLEAHAARLVFHNGCLVASEGIGSRDGLTVLPLDEALRKCPDLIEPHFMASETPLGSEKFAALHEANVTAGVFIHAARNCIPQAPVEIVHFIDGQLSAHFPHTLMVAEAGADVVVLEHWISTNDDATFVIGVNDLVASGGGRLKYAGFQRLNQQSKGIFINNTTAARDSDARSFILNTGGKWVRTESVSHVTGEGANVNLLSASIPGDEQEFDQRTYQFHKARNTTSDLLYKNALFDKSRTIFSGLIIVGEGAHHTDAYQTCRNLLMTPEAEANSLPGLEINADQVKCSHGSTSGQIEKEELFYLLARGIPEKAARKLITGGFLEEVFERFGHEAVRLLADEIMEEKFRLIGA